MAVLTWFRGLLLCVLLPGSVQVSAAAAAPTEQQVKAVFLFNFAHFVQWPAADPVAPEQPFVICLLGGEELAAPVAQAVTGERVGGRPLQVRQAHDREDIAGCQILFIGRSGAPHLDRIAALDRQGTLTVSDLDGAARRGVMIQLASERNRVRLVINVEQAHAAGLTISSNLLRPAEIVGSGD